MKQLLLMISLLVCAAHLQVELAWFHQFDLQSVLLQRWLIQLASAAAAVVLIGLASLWWRSLVFIETVERRAWIRGWRYGLALTTACFLRVGGATVIGLLLWQVLDDPAGMSDWWVISGRGFRWLLLLGINSSCLLRSRLQRWSHVLVTLAFVLAVSRSWQIWALALAIPSA